jgi:hypothetical protein
MDGIVGSLQLGWNALLLKDDAYEEMRLSDNPVVKGLVLIVIVGVVIALFGIVGDVLEWASTPNLDEIRETVFYYITQMPWWKMAAQEDPMFMRLFEQNYNMGWQIADVFSPSIGGAVANVIIVPLALIVRWLIYGLLAYLFARWLGGTAELSETLGVLALAVAPQALNVFNLLPYVNTGNIVAVWGILCAYVGIKTAHKLPWHRAVWATLLPFLLFLVAVILVGCLSSAIIAAVVKGG